MASWREIDRIRKDPAAMRTLASSLLRLFGADLTEWEVKFLLDISSDLTREELTTRQAEKLMQIRDDYERVSEIGYERLSVRIVIEECQLGCKILPEDHEQWILEFPKGTNTLQRRYISRLLWCARFLHILDEEDAA